MIDNSSQRRSRRPILVVFLLFFAPLAAAFLLYYFGTWRPHHSTAHGELIHPARPLPMVKLQDETGHVLAPTTLQAVWSLVFIGDGQCEERCRAALADMQRARELLGKDMPRVQSVFLASAHCCADDLRAIYPKLVVARLDDPDAAKIVAEFPSYDGESPLVSGRIYIVDPLGNLMMSYRADANSTGMYEDLKKLLGLSHIG
jgi:hypothetical protein